MRKSDWTKYKNKTKKAEEELTGIEFEDEADETELYDVEYKYPYRPEEIRIDQKMLSLFQICRWIEQDNLLLRPEFQRNFVWNKKQQSLLIESLMLKIPIPAFYFDEDAYGHRTVIDGMQRLTTIYRFVTGTFKLRGLQYLKECEGCSFSDLDWKYQSRIEETQLAVNILDAKCPSMVKFDVFRRINTGGVPLNPQEVRNIMAQNKTRCLLQQMAESSEFRQATHGKVNDVRMGAQELCLRFITFYRLYDDIKRSFSSFGDMTRLLDEMILELNDLNQYELDSINQKFCMSMKRCYALFGKGTFYKPGVKKAINRALFTSFSVLLAYAEYDWEWLECHQGKANTLLEHTLEESSDYYNAITSSTSSRRNMEIQFWYANKILEELL